MGIWRLVGLLGVAHALVAIAMAIVPGTEGTAGAIAYAAMYAGPAALAAAAVRSRRRGWRLAAGWSSLALSVFYVAVVIGNWPGYSSQQEAFAIAVNVPSVAVYLTVAWRTVLSRRAASPLPT